MSRSKKGTPFLFDTRRIRRMVGVPALLVLAFTATTLAARTVEKDPEIILREQMVTISRQLGVTCVHCHDPKNFKDRSLKTWKTAKEHIRVTAVLNSDKGFGEKPRVDCYLCHRGQAKPEFREAAK